MQADLLQLWMLHFFVLHTAAAAAAAAAAAEAISWHVAACGAAVAR
jgi:hypothetical protein